MTIHTYRGYPTVDKFWDRYQLEYQEIYDRFSLHSISTVDDLQRTLGFTGKRVLDIGGGTGLSAFRIAQHANFVISIEPSDVMRNYAVAKQKRLGVKNIQFLNGIGEDLSQFQDNEFDCAVSIATLPILFEEVEIRKNNCVSLVEGCLRIVKTGGHIAFVTGAHGWKWDYLVGGMDSFPDKNIKGPNEALLEPLGFTFRDIRVINDYGTMEEALATYGFIYGEKAIDYILENQVSKVSWVLRIFHRRLD
jgi:ubiquinone/menaquinone biosynthesis C-methylase UbiE